MTVLMGTECWSWNPRFISFQGANQKVRVIYDAKQSAVNSAYSSTVKLQLQDVDYVAAMVLGAMREAGLSGAEAMEWLSKRLTSVKLTNNWTCPQITTFMRLRVSPKGAFGNFTRAFRYLLVALMAWQNV